MNVVILVKIRKRRNKKLTNYISSCVTLNLLNTISLFLYFGQAAAAVFSRIFVRQSAGEAIAAATTLADGHICKKKLPRYPLPMYNLRFFNT